MKLRSIVAASYATLAIVTAGAASAHDGEGQTVTKNFDAVIPNVPAKSLIAVEVGFDGSGSAVEPQGRTR